MDEILREAMAQPLAFFFGKDFKIKTCCIIFFMTGWATIKEEISEYVKNMNGRVMCPDCLVQRIKQTVGKN